MKKEVAFFVLVIWISSGYSQKITFQTGDYVRALKHASDVMVIDVASPVAASRYYAYINLAANETIALFDKQQPHFAGVMSGLSEIRVDNSLIKKSDGSLAAMLALYKSATRLLPSGFLLQMKLDSLKLLATKRKLSPEKLSATERVADSVVWHVLQYASRDGFAKLSGLRRFTPSTGDEYWQPTPPGFMPAIEPNWGTLRTFVLDSCRQFAGAAPHPYSTDSNSFFYTDLREVYQVSEHLSNDQTQIAMFWDCNPFALQQIGHLEFGIKKMSPGGHWMGITGIACSKHKLSLPGTVYIHTVVSIAMADAFIACWSEKYRYNRVRPVTAIQRLIDHNWSPLLQTPPFPEYTSGHSVISTTASTILSYFFGDKFSFTDDTEKEFGLPARKFGSFVQASQEAALSRLYGGIHFRDAIENGMKEGEQIGKFVIAFIANGQMRSSPGLNAISPVGKK